MRINNMQTIRKELEKDLNKRFEKYQNKVVDETTAEQIYNEMKNFFLEARKKYKFVNVEVTNIHDEFIITLSK